MNWRKSDPDPEFDPAVVEEVLRGRAMEGIASIREYYIGISAGHHGRVIQAAYCVFLMLLRANSDPAFHDDVVRCCNARGIGKVNVKKLSFYVVLAVIGPEDEHDRQLASKYGRAIDVLLFDKCSPEEALDRLRKEGIASLASLAALKVPKRVRRKPQAADRPVPADSPGPGASAQPAGESAPAVGSTNKPGTVIDEDSPNVEPVDSTDVESPTVPDDDRGDDWMLDDEGFESELTVAVPGNIFDGLFTDGRVAVEAIMKGTVGTADGSQILWHVTKARKARDTTSDGD